MNNYPFTFLTEDVLTPGNYGKEACDFTIATKLKGIYKSKAHFELASLSNNEHSIELRLQKERRPGASYSPATYYLRIHNGLHLAGRHLSTIALSDVKTPNELKVNLSKKMREREFQLHGFEQYRQHVLERISFFYPHLTPTESKGFFNFLKQELAREMSAMYSEVEYELTHDTFNGYFEAIIHAESQEFTSARSASGFSDFVKEFEQEMMNHFSEMTLERRRKKGLLNESIHWNVENRYFEQLGEIRAFLTSQFQEILEVTSKGISVGIEGRYTSKGTLFRMYTKENAQHKQTIGRYEDKQNYHMHIWFKEITSVFKDRFADDLESLTLVYTDFRDSKRNSKDVVDYFYHEMQDEIQDTFLFELFAQQKPMTYESNYFVYLWTTSKSVSESEVMRERTLQLMNSIRF